jgi:6-pyruvoyltetrahydropterin/6-carboxytetrahydropterin synthase
MSYRVRVEGTTLRFSAAHFATFQDDLEPLHGHSYAVTADIAGELTEDSWVLDFGDAKRITAAVCDELDHKFILQRDSRHLSIKEDRGVFEVEFQDRRYMIPATDVASLPIDNSTSERLAEWLAGRLHEELQRLGLAGLRSISVGVEEAPGQSAWFTLEL